jgi:hypothetical protein
MDYNQRNVITIFFFILAIIAILLPILLRPTCSSGPPGPAVLPNTSGIPVAVPLYFETNDLLQTTADNTNIIEVFGNNANAPGAFKQRLSGILTTVDTANRVTIRNQRDVTSYVVGDPSVYDAQFPTIQSAIDQAVADGVNVNVSPARQAQILVKAGDYPGDILISNHGISIIGLTDGRDRIVRIQGTLTILPLDASGKTLINIKNLTFEGGVSGTPSIVLSSSASFNPKALMQNILVRDGRQIICNGIPVPVELTLTNSVVEDIVCNGNCSLSLDNSISQGLVFISNDPGELGAVVLSNNSQANIQTDDSKDSNYNIFSYYSTVSVTAHLTPATMISPFSAFLAKYSTINVTTGILNPNPGTLAMSCEHCIGTVDVGSTLQPFPQGVLKFEQCIFEYFTLRCNAPLSTDTTSLYFSKCSWEPDTAGRNRCIIEDYSTVAHGSFPVTVETNQCHFNSPLAVSGLNVQITDVQSYHDISRIQPAFPSPLGIYELNNGARLIPYNCTYRLRSLADFVVQQTAGVGVSWVQSTASLGGLGSPQPNNYIMNVGATSGNYQIGTVVAAIEGDAIV